MTASTDTHTAVDTPSSTAAGRTAMLALAIVVLIGVAVALVAIGLDAFNDVLVRGFTSLPGAAG